MKKQLMTTTAIVAAGVLAASGTAFAQKKASKPKWQLGGWFEGIVGAADNESHMGKIGVDVHHDAEIHFKSVTKLDNGIKIRVRLELEGQSQALGATTNGDDIDEAYVAISGGFGEIRIGSEDNAAHLMVTPTMGSWATSVGQNLSFDVKDWVGSPSSFTRLNTARVSLGEADSQKVTYFTPRISGFQLGVTYMPSFEEDANGSVANRSTKDSEGFAVGAKFAKKWDGFGIALAAGFGSVHDTNDSNKGKGDGDPSAYAFSGKIDVGRITIGAGYMNQQGMASATGDIFDLGIRYNAGKNKFSLGYNQGEARGTLTDTDEDVSKQAMLSYRRELGPGIQYRLNFMWADWNEETDDTNNENDGFAVTTSIRLSF